MRLSHKSEFVIGCIKDASFLNFLIASAIFFFSQFSTPTANTENYGRARQVHPTESPEKNFRIKMAGRLTSHIDRDRTKLRAIAAADCQKFEAYRTCRSVLRVSLACSPVNSDLWQNVGRFDCDTAYVRLP